MNPRDIALYQNSRARFRSAVRQARPTFDNGGSYVGYDADSAQHILLQDGDFVATQDITTGGKAPGDRVEGAGNFVDSMPRRIGTRQVSTNRKAGQSFIASAFLCKYQYGPRVAASDGTLYAKYLTWIALKESGKQLLNLYLPWRGSPVFSTDPLSPPDTIAAYDGNVGISAVFPPFFQITYLSQNTRILQTGFTYTPTPVEPSLVDYPVRTVQQPNESTEGTSLSSAFGFQSTLFTMLIEGTQITQLEATRDYYTPEGQAVQYSDWWDDYLDYLYLGTNYAPGSGSLFPNYRALGITDGGDTTLHKGRAYKLRKPTDITDTYRIKRILKRNPYQVGTAKPYYLVVDPSEFNLPESADLTTGYYADTLTPYATWLDSDEGANTRTLLFYQQAFGPGPINANRFWTFELRESRFTFYST